MFPDRYFPARYFANRYWPPGESSTPPTPAAVGGRLPRRKKITPWRPVELDEFDNVVPSARKRQPAVVSAPVPAVKSAIAPPSVVAPVPRVSVRPQMLAKMADLVIADALRTDEDDIIEMLAMLEDDD